MNCEDVRKALARDRADMEAVRRHLKQCPACKRELAREVEIEEALRGLYSDLAPVDITGEVRSAIVSINSRRSRQRLVRMWTWIAVSATVFALLLVTMPDLAAWTHTGFEAVGELAGPQSALCRSWVRPASMQSGHLLFAMGAILISALIYIWREARMIPR